MEQRDCTKAALAGVDEDVADQGFPERFDSDRSDTDLTQTDAKQCGIAKPGEG